MKKHLLLCAALLATAPGTSTAGQTVYTYTGLEYTEITDLFLPAGTYTTAMKLTGSLTLQDALGPNARFVNLLLGDPGIVDFSFFDGRFTYDIRNASAAQFFFFTDASGSINEWSVGFFRTNPAPGVLRADAGSTGGSLTISPGDGAKVYRDAGNRVTVPDAAQSFELGSWTMAPVPEPSTYVLMLAGLGLVSWKMTRQAIAIRIASKTLPRSNSWQEFSMNSSCRFR